MANHVKTQIRDAAATACTSLTTTGARVYKARPDDRPLQASELPCLLIYTDEEVQEVATLGGPTRRLTRMLDLMIDGIAAGSGDIDATLDTIAKEVETALAADATLGGLAKDLYPTRQEKERDAAGETPAHRIRMTFAVEYHTRQNAPDAALA